MIERRASTIIIKSNGDIRGIKKLSWLRDLLLDTV